MLGSSLRYFIRAKGGRVLLTAGAAMLLGPALAGCELNTASLFNPAFVDVVASGDGANELATINNAPGHVPVMFVNNTRFSAQLTSYLEALNADRRLSGVDPLSTDLSNLRPRLRVPVRVTYANAEDSVLTFEFIDGDGVVEVDTFSEEDETGEEDAGLVTEAPTDPRLTERDLTRLVATCDVARVEVLESAQVFVPVFVRTIDIETPEFGGRIRVVEQIDPPQFRPVLVDELNDDFSITLLRNFSFEDGPAPAENLRCGAVVGIVLSGTVAVPFTGPETNASDEFIQNQDEVPGFINTDNAAEASIPGRYRFDTTVR